MIFGTPDSGVARPARADGVTLLDEIWAGAPCRGKEALVRRVRTVVDNGVRAGPLRPADGAGVVSTARRAARAR
ncbi:hypothetical protein ACIRPR_19710 [Streptomyces griseoflavus]|uniref:hypothetical protein n=1 Tax=Streptomyces griseoflavus TaxID=35619 RepID=UPI00382C4C68